MDPFHERLARSGLGAADRYGLATPRDEYDQIRAILHNAARTGLAGLAGLAPTSVNTSSDQFSGSAITTRHARPNSRRCWPTHSRHRKLTRHGNFTGSRKNASNRPKQSLTRTYT
ncbi:hypothetical protein AB0H28_28680 [Micromonospora sp. NPDC050980]|uniref:hypothetical protein n=1 Tax=Micromonospora sp. NPDC050980 TaxID=3155161 RepID=UPI0033F0E993